jgi:RAP domain
MILPNRLLLFFGFGLAHCFVPNRGYSRSHHQRRPFFRQAESFYSDALPPPLKSKHRQGRQRDEKRDRVLSQNATSHGRTIPDELPSLSLLLKSPNVQVVLSKAKETHNEPWRADYHTSKKTQILIQSSVNQFGKYTPVDRAEAVLETFLSMPPSSCNAANLACALTLSAKTLGRSTSDHLRSLLFQTNNILYQMLEKEYLSTRQLCNAVWALAKHYDRDNKLLPDRPDATSLSSDTIQGQAELWDLRNDLAGCPTKRVDASIDEIARQLTVALKGDIMNVKEGEICMACWSFGILRRRRRPPGWKNEPQLSNLPNKKIDRAPSNFLKFEQWKTDRRPAGSFDMDIDVDDADDLDEASITGDLFDIAGRALTQSRTINLLNETADAKDSRIAFCTWKEIANLAWAYASVGRACSQDAEAVLKVISAEAIRRLTANRATSKVALSRDVSQIIWSLGVLQADNFRLGDGLVDFVIAVSNKSRNDGVCPCASWSCTDIGQVVLSLAHARIDDRFLLETMFAEACRRFRPLNSHDKATALQWKAWEICILLWAQARLYLTGSQSPVFREFANRAITDINKALREGSTFHDMEIGPQEQANIAWSLTVLEMYNSPEAVELLQAVFAEAEVSCEKDGVIQLEHAHQLWQSLYLLQDECPKCTEAIPRWFQDCLQEKWLIEKSRPKISSARHLSISKTLTLMGVAHYNEHDEDIDVAIVLKPDASWTHETESSSVQFGVRVAVEFDGPYHFTRQRRTVAGSKLEPPRALGHTVLKYRLLKKQGWTVVRVPYYEYDKIPFWASMERQRYLQRLLKTHGNLRFSHVDVSKYKALVPNRGSRFD